MIPGRRPLTIAGALIGVCALLAMLLRTTRPESEVTRGVPQASGVSEAFLASGPSSAAGGEDAVSSGLLSSVLDDPPEPATNPRAGERALSRLRFSDPRAWVTRKFGSVLPYTETKQYIAPDRVLELHAMLSEQELAPYWENIADAIGFVSQRQESVPVLLDYVRRADDWSGLDAREVRKRGCAKMHALRWIGKIGGAEANTALRSAFTPEGARELVEKWIRHERFWISPENEECNVSRVETSAAVGLVLTQQPDNVALVVDRHARDRQAVTAPDRPRKYLIHYNTCVEAMMAKSLIDQRGLEGYLSLIGTQEGFDLSVPLFAQHRNPPVRIPRREDLRKP